MVFSSLNFLFIFFPLVMLLHLIAPKQLKNPLLLIASLFFYAWGEPVYIVLMLISVAFNYVTGLQIAGRSRSRGAQRAALIAALIVNLGALGFFKYYGFAVDIFNGITGLGIQKRELPLPIGISFYTFQALSYVIDVYRGKVKAQRSIINFAVYITMFPQLVAGPIVVYSDIEAQLASRRLTLERCGYGAQRLAQGLAKKVLLANNLGMLYEAIQQSASRSVMTAWLGAIAYTLQIYFDFSGYSDMAIGMGHMLGFKFIENFNFPYMAKSVTDFWRRWHISLSGWFRDYVYIPLGGNRVKPARHIMNLLIVWMLTGLWHGANLNFVIWGLYYGVLLIIEKYLTGDALKRMPDGAARAITLILVIIGWVIFSNTDFGQMRAYLGNMIGIGAAGFADGAFLYHLRGNLVLLIIGIICSTTALRDLLARQDRRAPILSAAISAVLFIISTAYLVYGSYNPFLYFRF